MLLSQVPPTMAEPCAFLFLFLYFPENKSTVIGPYISLVSRTIKKATESKVVTMMCDVLVRQDWLLERGTAGPEYC